jgi:hypothetical protein
METHYKSSKGLKVIAEMSLPYAKNALAKLRREEPGRTAEIDAIAAHVAKVEAALEAEGDNPRAVIGGNNPPAEETPADPKAGWAAIKIHMDDLLTETQNWADGVAITTPEQAEAVGRLKQDLQTAASDADAARVTEKKPFDDATTEIQDRYNAYIAPLKNKKPGTVSKAVLALNNLLTPWLTKLDDERRAREAEASAAAAKAAAEALAAHTEAKASTDLTVIDTAEDKLAEAEALIRQAKGISSEKVQVQGSVRAVGLRSYWVAELDEKGGADAIRYYLKTRPERIKALIQQLADEDVRAGARHIPGFTVREDRRAA